MVWCGVVWYGRDAALQQTNGRIASVAWPNVPYSVGGWANWSDAQKDRVYLGVHEADGAIYLAGEHLSNLTGWQEGAILSADRAIAAIASRIKT